MQESNVRGALGEIERGITTNRSFRVNRIRQRSLWTHAFPPFLFDGNP